jgi:hypothetical protein
MWKIRCGDGGCINLPESSELPGRFLFLTVVATAIKIAA